MTIHSSFYASQLACLLVWSGLVRVMTGRHLHALCAGAVLTRPPWLSARWLLLLDKHRSSVFAALPVVLAVAAVWPSSWPVRLIAAVAVSLYHLLESSGTNRHGEYPLLYNALGMLLPADHAHAFALGVAIHFVLSSGVAKLQYGGRAWLEEGTMRVYLDVYRSSSSGPPLSRALSQWLSRRAWATRAIARATVLLECVLVPAALLLPPAWRPLCCWAMALMHVGIALAMSLRVGVVFLTTLPGYVLGFSCAAPLLSPAWLLALAVGALPTALALARGAPLPEAWPLSPISLFMWSGEQAQRLSSSLMTADTRLVLGTARDRSAASVVGRRVVHHGARPKAAEEAVLYDAVLRAVGFTLVHAELGSLLAADDGGGAGEGWGRATRRLSAWLQAEGRLLEARSGEPLRHAFFVRVDVEGRVAEVLNF